MHPSERRPGLPRENPFVFWPRFIWQSLRKNALIIGRIVHLSVVAHRISRRDDAKRYMDQALTPVDDHDDETLDLLTKTTGGATAVAHLKNVARLTTVSKAG